MYKGRLECLRTGTRETPVLWWDYYDRETGQWSTEHAVISVDGHHVLSSGAPAVTHANDFLYCVNHRTHGDSRLWWTRFNLEGPEAGWSPQRLVTDHRGNDVRSANPPAATVYDGLLYCVHDGNGRLRWITYDTARRTWSADQPVPGDIPTARAPAVDRFKDHLYCVHDRGGNDLYWTTYDSKTREWSADHHLVDWNGHPIRTAHAPALTRYNDYLYCVYYVGQGSGNGRLWWTRYNVGEGWSPPHLVPSAVAAPGFDVTPYGGALYCVHQG